MVDLCAIGPEFETQTILVELLAREPNLTKSTRFIPYAQTDDTADEFINRFFGFLGLNDFLELHEIPMEPMMMGPYGLRDPYCHADQSKLGTMRAEKPWVGYCAPKMYQSDDGLFYAVQWRLNPLNGEFW